MIRRIGLRRFEGRNRRYNEMARFADGRNISIDKLLFDKLDDVSKEVDRVRDVVTLISDQPLYDAAEDVYYSLEQLAEFIEGYGCLDINKRGLCGFDKVESGTSTKNGKEVCSVRLTSFIGDASFSWNEWQKQEDLTDAFGYYEFRLKDGGRAAVNLELSNTSSDVVKLLAEVWVWR